MALDNANPTIFQRTKERIVTPSEEDDDIVDEIDEREVYDILFKAIDMIQNLTSHMRAHLHLHCPSIRVRVRVRDPDRIVLTLHPRLGSEVFRVHGPFGSNLVATTWTGGFEHARFITSDVLGRPRPRKSLHVAMSSDTDIRDESLRHGLGSM